MCELLALASRLPTVATLSLERFVARGGLDRRLIDGWGLGFYDGHDVRLYREPEAARDSAWVQFIAARRIATHLLLSHVRHATRGAVTLANTQPFAREIGGRMHCFAHNGQLAYAPGTVQDRTVRFDPLGETDSEQAACELFRRIAERHESAASPALAERLAIVRDFAAELRERGPANFLYCDGETLFAHADRRMQRDGQVAPPGLWCLSRRCAIDTDALSQAGVHLESTCADQQLTLLASVPLSDAEPWVPLARGTVVAIENGAVVREV